MKRIHNFFIFIFSVILLISCGKIGSNITEFGDLKKSLEDIAGQLKSASVIFSQTSTVNITSQSSNLIQDGWFDSTKYPKKEGWISSYNEYVIEGRKIKKKDFIRTLDKDGKPIIYLFYIPEKMPTENPIPVTTEFSQIYLDSDKILINLNGKRQISDRINENRIIVDPQTKAEITYNHNQITSYGNFFIQNLEKNETLSFSEFVIISQRFRFEKYSQYNYEMTAKLDTNDFFGTWTTHNEISTQDDRRIFKSECEVYSKINNKRIGRIIFNLDGTFEIGP